MKQSGWRHTARGAPRVIGHRGASALELENTLPAFRRARADGADGVELDVLRCATGEVVVFHDDDLRRLAGRLERVRELSLTALRAVRLVGGGVIPTLSEVFEELGPTMLVNVELKASHLHSGQRLAPAVAALIRRHDAAARVLVSSFNPAALLRFRAAAPAVPIGLLFAHDQTRPLRDAWARRVLRPAALHPEHVLADADAVDRWHEAGYAVNVWTVDDVTDLRRVVAAGVDGVITNDPARTRQWLQPCAGCP